MILLYAYLCEYHSISIPTLKRATLR
jgi:hypothetical protein